MKYLRNLDKTLRFLNKYNHGSYVYYDRDNDPQHVNNKNNPVIDKKDQLYWCFEEKKIHENLRLPIIDHLIGDGFVKPHFDKEKPESGGFAPHQIKITYKGIAFINKFRGGYVKERINNIIITSLKTITVIIATLGVVISALWAIRQLTLSLAF